MLNDLRFAVRMMLKHRWFSLAVIVTLALGIGVNTTVFTLVNAVLFKPVPVPGGERIVTVSNRAPGGENRHESVSLADYREYRAQNRTFEGLEGAALGDTVLSENDNPPQRYEMARITAGLFGLLHVPPVLGRGFSPDDDKPGAARVVLISYSVWQKRYAGQRDVIGRHVRVNGEPGTIVGVMPPDFQFPNVQDVWLPLVPDEELLKRSNHSLWVFGIMKPGTTVAMANEDLAVIGRRLATAYPETNKDLRPSVRTFHDTFNGDRIRAVFLTMLGAVGFVLLIACANVANMLLGRAVARAREISVRAAVGASRWQLVRQLLVESVLLSVLGGLLGLGLSWFGVHAFDLATRDVGKPYWVVFSMDWRAFMYFAAISLASGIVFGLVPALRASRVDLNTAMKDGTPAGGSARGGKLSAALVVVQFTLTMVLLAGAGLMVRSFFAAQSLNAFVRPEHLLTGRLQVPEGKGERYSEPAARARLMRELLPALGALPGAAQVAATNFLPGTGAAQRDLEIEDHPNVDPKQPAHGAAIVQTPGYLGLIGLPLLEGRDFDEIDGDFGREAAVVTRQFAAKFWPGGSPIGQRFRQYDNGKPGPWMTVIGMTADIVQDPQNPEAPPLYFIAHRQEPWGWMAVVLRTSGDPAGLASAMRATVQKLDPDLPLSDVAVLPSILEHEHWFLKVFGTLFLVFALIGLAMASVGIYAVVAQSTARRTREIGIRMALGATGRHILQLVLARGLGQLGLGLALGLGGAVAAAHLLAQVGFLFQISPDDPVVLAAIVGLLLAIGLFACWLPARRAAALHPVEALRQE